MTDKKCVQCQFYRAQTERKVTEYDLHCNPVEHETIPTGSGECMLLPPNVAFRQGRADTRKTWAGPVTSVINPGFTQQRPIVVDADFCSCYSREDDNQ